MQLTRRLATLCLTLTLLCLGAPRAQAAGDKGQSAGKGNSDRALTVMTYNMFPGTVFDEIFEAQSAGELVAEVAEAFAEVQAGNPPARIEGIADQIAAAEPSLVSLQEVALWRTGAFNSPEPATAVAYDFLQLLLDELAERGQHYEPLEVLTNLDAEAPAAFSPTLAFDVRFTDRLVVLARTDLKTSQLKIDGVEAHHFTFNLPFSSPFLGDLTILRGWIAVDVKMRGKTFRFVNAHLESFSPLVQFIQAEELLGTAAATGLPVVLAGDFNSDAEGGGASYQRLLAGGFADAWEATHPNDPGFTWPLFVANRFVVNPFAYTPPTERLDLVLTRGEIETLSTDIAGEENVTPARPMPSDHAGVTATLRLLP